MFAEGARLKALHGPSAVADLSLGQPLEATAEVRAAFARAAAQDWPGRFGYLDNLGHPATRAHVAAACGLEGIPPEAVVMTCGAAGALVLALAAFCPPGGEVLGTGPYFPEFTAYARSAGGSFVALDAHPTEPLDLEALGQALSPSTAVLLLNSPNNPSGRVLTDDHYAQLAATLAAHEATTGRTVVLVVDEVYTALHYDGARSGRPFDHWPATLLVRSYSKDLGIAGERLGYLVANPALDLDQLTQRLRQLLRAYGFVNAPSTAQLAIVELGAHQVRIDPYRERRKLLAQALQGAGIEASLPDGGLYCFFDAPGGDDVSFVTAMAEQRLLFAPGVAFGQPGKVRACFSVELETLELATSILDRTHRTR